MSRATHKRLPVVNTAQPVVITAHFLGSSATFRRVAFRMPFAGDLKTIKVDVQTTIAANANDYWTLKATTAAGVTTITDTRASTVVGGAITADTAVTLTAVSAGTNLAAGAAVEFVCTKTANGADLSANLITLTATIQPR